MGLPPHDDRHRVSVVVASEACYWYCACGAGSTGYSNRDNARDAGREHLRGQAGDAPWTCARCDKPIHAEPHTDSDGADVHPDCCEACHPERGA